MRIIGSEEISKVLDHPSLIEALREMFLLGCDTPTRHHHAVTVPNGTAGTLLIMPAWQAGGMMGVKTVTIFPDNPARGLPTVLGQYYLMDSSSGEPLAMVEGTVLTLWRTAAASALASSYLSRPSAKHMLMVGSGSLAPHLILAHAAVRPISTVRVWSRNPKNANKLARRLEASGLNISPTEDLENATAWADIISCATLSKTPLIRGKWLKPGAHLDLVGAFRPDMRESDDDAVVRARVFADTQAGALSEAGDILLPIASGAFDKNAIVGDLLALTSETVAGRISADDITLFKSVGAALEDLAAARLVFKRCNTP